MLTTHEILIGDVEIIAILILFSPSIENIFEAIPDSAFIPAPIKETLAIFGSESAPSASSSVDKFSKIDVLVNNAALYGALKSSRFEDIDPDQWDKAMNVNVKGLWNCCRAISPIMRENKSGSIINIASLAAKYGMPYAADYATSKAAVIGLTRVMAREMGKDNIRVNAVAPSMVRTESAKEFLGEKAERGFEVISKGQILQKTLEVDDIYGTVLYLASDQSKFVTGQTLMVDGGSVLL